MSSFLAISAGVGERSSECVSSSRALLTWEPSSCKRRGIRIAHVLSRKCRLISPTIVGVAKVENSNPIEGSNRSIALMRPMVPTCTISSSGSPRSANLRAMKCTRGKCRSIRAARSGSRSGLLASRAANCSSISRSCCRESASGTRASQSGQLDDDVAMFVATARDFIHEC